MKIEKIEDGYKKIIYNCNNAGNIIEEIVPCVMCKKVAFFVAEETDEALCLKCRDSNDEARFRHGRKIK